MSATLIVDILASAARECSVTPPSSWLTTASPSAVALRDDHMRRVADDILDRLDLPSPASGSVSITGDGSESYDLPSEFRRLQNDDFAVQETQASGRRVAPIFSDGEWEYLKTTGNVGAQRVYRLTGRPGAWSISFLRTLATGESIKVGYVTDNWLVGASGSVKAAFTDEGDACFFPRELVEVGIVYRFRQRKGLAYDDVKAEFEALLARYGNNSRGRGPITYGRRQARSPFDIPVPDTIPSS